MIDGRIYTGHIQADSNREKNELKLSSAFASLAVLENEDHAVAFKKASRTDPFEPVHVVITSTTHEPPHVTVTSAPQRMNGVFTEEPRSDDLEATEQMLRTPDIPSQFKEFKKERRKRGGFDDTEIWSQYIDNVLPSQGFLVCTIAFSHFSSFTDVSPLRWTTIFGCFRRSSTCGLAKEK